MINFNDGVKLINTYRGSEIKEKHLYNNDIYMLKFPDPVREKNNPLRYMNNQFSEHIGSSIFRECGFNTQETVLGIAKDPNGVDKIVVGCKDFTSNGSILHEFSVAAQSILKSHESINMTKMEIDTVKWSINACDFIKNKAEILDCFWDMFVIDTLIGNTDRHLGNWGLLEKNNIITFAPIYDCGSSLGALLDDDTMKDILIDPSLFKRTGYNINSCYYQDGKKIFYHEIFKKLPQNLVDAVKRVVPNINMENIRKIVNSTEGISDTRKEYLNKALDMRYKEIIKPAYNRILRQEMNMSTSINIKPNSANTTGN